MPELNLNLWIPSDGKQVSVFLDDSMKVQELIGELVANKIVPRNDLGYELIISKTGLLIGNEQMLAHTKLSDGDKIVVIPICYHC